VKVTKRNVPEYVLEVNIWELRTIKYSLEKYIEYLRGTSNWDEGSSTSISLLAQVETFIK